jgi:hypothetical protein
VYDREQVSVSASSLEVHQFYYAILMCKGGLLLVSLWLEIGIESDHKGRQLGVLCGDGHHAYLTKKPLGLLGYDGIQTLMQISKEQKKE